MGAGRARVLDTSLRYTIDKTTREVLFLPLPTDLKYRAKPFVDVTVDRFAKAVGALLLLVLIKVAEPRLARAQLREPGADRTVDVHGDARAERVSQDVPAQHRNARDGAGERPPRRRRRRDDRNAGRGAVEPRRVVACSTRSRCSKRSTSAISSRRCCCITSRPGCGRVRCSRSSRRARRSPARCPVDAGGRAHASKDEDAGVRAAAVRALAALAMEDASTLMRRYLADPDPRVAVTAAVVMADSGNGADAHAAEDDVAAPDRRHPQRRRRRAPGSGRRARAHQEPRFPPAAGSADGRRRPRGRAPGHSQRGIARPSRTAVPPRARRAARPPRLEARRARASSSATATRSSMRSPTS